MTTDDRFVSGAASDQTDLNALIERLSSSTGPDEELGREVLRACGWRKTCVGHFYGPLYNWSSPDGSIGFKDDDFRRYDPTRSIDAAMMLVPEGWHGFVRFGKWPEHDNEFQSVMWSGDRSIPESFFGVTSKPAATLAIALTIAALSARTRTARGESGAEDHSIQKERS